MDNPKNQSEAVLYHLKNEGSITSWEAVKEYGATRLSAIIFNLRKDGYNIESIPKKSKNRFGNSVTFVEYVLLKKEPIKQQELFFV